MAASIVVYPLFSPRIIEITYPQTSVTIQELHDAIRAWEDLHENQQWEYLIETTGEQDLGGGLFVGLTAQLNNAQIYFPSRSTPIDNTQTCTTADPEGRVLISTGSTFISDGIDRGYTVYNSTTGAMSVVLSVDSENQLTHLPLTGGSRNDWQVGDGIVTYNNEQCSVTGGNLVAVDDMGASIPPVLQAALAQVDRTSSSSATLLELTPGDLTSLADAIEAQLFARAVEGSETFEEIIRLLRANAAGTIVRAGDVHHLRDAADSKDRIVATANASGRTVTAVDGT